MNDDLFRGRLTRLSMVNPQTMAEAFSHWQRDSEYSRLENSETSFPHSTRIIKEWIEKYQEKDPTDVYWFTIHTLDENRLIGELGLDGIRWNHGDTYVGIGIGDRQDWNKGYGTDAMRIILRYAFTELNLQRVTLNVFEYNPRAIRSYEKAGFKHEGRVREYLHRGGRRWDLVYMGILREEWLNQNGYTSA